MKWVKRIGIGFVALLAILLVLPFFISLNDYIPRIEKEASTRLGEPVSIKSLKVTLLRLPHMTVDGITVGKTQDITIGKVTVAPELMSLLASVKVIRAIEVKRLVLTQKALDKIPVWTKADPKTPPHPNCHTRSRTGDFRRRQGRRLGGGSVRQEGRAKEVSECR